MKIATATVLLCVLAVLGCQRKSGSAGSPTTGHTGGRPKKSMSDKISDLSGRMLGLNQRDKYLPPEDLVAAVGEPDRKVSLQEFIELCDQADVLTAGHGMAPVDHAYHMYKIRALGDISRLPWQENEAFLACRVWLYCWDKPERILSGREHPYVMWESTRSYFFLVRSDGVITPGRLIRESKRIR
ncbi:MAG: hypothetical protein ACYS8X_14875 [Planctomycetota bacterium]|jgi:hypothetical protein